MDTKTCPVCGKRALIDLNGSFETDYIDRKGVRQKLSVPNVQRLHCKSCKEEIFDDAVTRRIEDERRRAMGLLSADQIRALRLKLGKTQLEMSRFLGVGEKTYCRWESGGFIQSQSFDNYLRLIRDVPEATFMLVQLETQGVGEIEATVLAGKTPFEFLTDTDGLSEQAVRFTDQMLTGTLYVGV
jgi:putative zinc finger/helix-turn-helix YgiT family protein